MSKRTSRTVAAAVAAVTAAALAVGSAPVAAADPYPGGISVGSPPIEPGTYSSELKAANGNGDSVSFVIVGDLAHNDNIRTYMLLWRADWSTESLTLLPGDAGGSPVGINNARTVVGTSAAQVGGRQHAVRWTSPSTPTEMLPLPGDTTAAPAAIGDNGTAVGSSWGAAGAADTKHAVAWPASGAPVALPPLPGDTESEAVAVNSSGTAVGYSYPAGGLASRRAVAWSPDGTVTAFDVPAGYVTSSAARITDSGVVIGAGRPGGEPSVDHALVWNAAGAVSDLGAGSQATAVNNAGTVVGGLGGQAARWAVDGTPLPLAPTTVTSVATGINDQGVVVGYTSDPWPARAQLHAQRWNPDGSVIALPEWSKDFPYSMPLFVTNSGIVLGELLLRGLAGYGKPLTIRWTM
ncbi:hypothetical protein [Kitasatospora sp. NBC_01300]|uniref:hypothetical protein n=1 Tax=Kitasatospora sp. NBC_01300 TaxID=2903574 RepID=UPI002F90BC7C|nr:hypothetical protein OG556_39325 [Kitasatospora sp. NBC_01300]